MRDDIVRCCGTCMFAKILPINGDILCPHEGLVSPKGLCKKYRYNIFLPPPPKKRTAKRYNKKDFEL